MVDVPIFVEKLVHCKRNENACQHYESAQKKFTSERNLKGQQGLSYWTPESQSRTLTSQMYIIQTFQGCKVPDSENS